MAADRIIYRKSFDLGKVFLPSTSPSPSFQGHTLVVAYFFPLQETTTTVGTHVTKEMPRRQHLSRNTYEYKSEGREVGYRSGVPLWLPRPHLKGILSPPLSLKLPIVFVREL